MDPNETLKILRAAAQRVIGLLDEAQDGDDLTVELDGEQIADLVEASNALAESSQALDEWISKGGFLPSAWNKHKRS